jgi:hypothetical protein
MVTNGNHQRVIPVAEVETYVSQGWEFVAALSNEKAVLKLPQSGVLASPGPVDRI